jgi:hypothetical protein
LLAGGPYLVGVAACRAIAPGSLHALLGFSTHATAAARRAPAVLDITSAAEPLR